MVTVADWSDHLNRIGMILMAMHAAERIDDLRLPSFRLHQMKGDRKGQWSTTVRANWRIVFVFSDGDCCDVGYVDYH